MAHKGKCSKIKPHHVHTQQKGLPWCQIGRCYFAPLQLCEIPWIPLGQTINLEQSHKKKRDELNLKFKNLYWLLGRRSVLSVDNKLLIYNSILKPIWTYGIPLWGSAAKSNIMCLQRAQNNVLKAICNPPWFIKTSEVHDYLGVPTVQEEIASYKMKYKLRLANHPNSLASNLLDPSNLTHRLKRANVLHS